MANSIMKEEALPSPNDQLAMQIADALVAAGLIRDSHNAPLLSKLKAGGAKQEDWDLWIDIAASEFSHYLTSRN